ncbi:FecR family protein [Aquimarina litoralis]|uniref:FecR family protein n=1 Tax=Aquimarina litoralis TaxID=584605 RepID=UPI001C568DFF|nr:FecR domain-containing protein [Aquimarina litoralis]MBW1295465.1 DUF4974 domain-containing protein [Aquimarina litoralis]
MEDFKITESELWEYISKTANNITIKKVERWMHSSDFDEALFNNIKTIYNNTATPAPSTELAKDRFFRSVQPKNKKVVWKDYLKYAAVLIILISGAYFYNIISSSENQLIVQTTFGEQKSIQLSDGSKVWLNASSKLSYAPESPRTLFLQGEAFFEVAKDSLRPFTVTTPDHITVTALGTSFNVKSYTDSQTTETRLLTGKVKVTSDKQFSKSIFMNPDDKVIFNKDTQEITKSKMDITESNIAWMEGKIQFKNKPFSEIAIDLKAQYGTEIRFKNKDVAATRFTGSFDNATPLDEIFEILKISKDFTYKLNTKANEWIIQ